MKSNWVKISLVFLFLVAFIGTLLRSVDFLPFHFHYANWVHAHSHTAFQGWIYLTQFLFLTRIYLSENQIKKHNYPILFKITAITVVGVLISFAMQGYGLYSIIISTIFQVLCYAFFYYFLRDTRGYAQGNKVSLKFIKTGLWFGVLSSLLPFAIGIASAKGLCGTEIYFSLIYSFLHLQYNGWFLLVMIGLFYQFLEREKIPFSQSRANTFYYLFSWGVIPSISLSLLGMSYAPLIKVLAYLSSILLAISLMYFILSIPKNLKNVLSEKPLLFRIFLGSFLFCFVLKIILQCLSVFPYFLNYAFHNKPIILAYLHLNFIGVISLLLLALIFERNWLPINTMTKLGSYSFIVGFILSELALLLSGFGILSDKFLEIFGSLGMLVGVLLLLISPKS